MAGLDPAITTNSIRPLHKLLFPLLATALLVLWSSGFVGIRFASEHAPARISSVVYLSPPVTMIWAWAMFGEPLTLMMFAGLAVTFAGVWLASFKPGACR